MFTPDCAPKNVIARKIFEEYQSRYDQGLPCKHPEILLDNLTKPQRTFIQEYLKDLDATRAVSVSYNTKYPNRVAFQLLRNPKIVLTIQLLQIERAKKSNVTKDYVLKKVMKIIEETGQPGDADYNPNAALRGLELLARHLGMFIDRTEITGKDGEAIKYEKVTEDARDFTSTIISLAERHRAEQHPLKVVGGTEG